MVEGSSTAYLAIAGGFAVPPFMGSLSTYSRAGVGGFEGRKLAAGDALPLLRATAPAGDERKLAQPFDYGSGPVRVVWGPQEEYFSAEGRRTFVTQKYRVSKEADRMGIRFEGPVIAHATSVQKGGADIISDGIGPGAIQVPGAGLPIVLLADRQTVGGYPKIATVASVDMPRLLMGIAAFFRNESCGQCVPCRVGTVRQQEALARLVAGEPRGGVERELALIGEVGQCMRDASICGLGQTASSAVESAIRRLHVFQGNPA